MSSNGRTQLAIIGTDTYGRSELDDIKRRIAALETQDAATAADIEVAQDAVGTILADSATIDFTYNDATPSITAIVIDDSMSNAKLRNSAALSVIGRSANTTGDPADITVTAASDSVLRESGSTLGFGQVATAGIANAAITNAKLANMAQGLVKGRVLASGTGAPVDLQASDLNDITGSANLIMADTMRIETDEVRARDAGGLKLYDDAGNGIFVEDGGQVGIGTAAPAYKLDGLVAAGAQNIFRFGQSGVSNGFTLASDGSTLTYALLDGNVGIGTTSPQGKLHAHDGTGGMLFVSKTAIAGTAIVLIPNGTGDVVTISRTTYTVKPSSGTAVSGTVELLNNASAAIFTSGSDILTLRVNADGSMDVRRTGGSLTYSVTLHIIWQ